MLLNLNDPSSIVAWWQVLPERHGSQLKAMARMWPQYALPIRAAMRRIATDPALTALHARALLAERAAHRLARQALEQADAQAVPLAA